MSERVYILTHTDLDGFFSGGIIKFFHEEFINNEATFKTKTWTYGRELPDIKYITTHFDTVYVADLCPDSGFMLALRNHFGYDHFIWIDHHSKPDQDFINYCNIVSTAPIEINGVRELREHVSSAAKLSWEWFHKMGKQLPYYPDKGDRSVVPMSISYISEFDCWKREDESRWNDKVMPMFSYFKMHINSPEDAYDWLKKMAKSGGLYDIAGKNAITELYISLGVVAYKTTKQIYNSEAKRGFQRSILVDPATNTYLNAWVCNTQERSSVIFEDMPNKDEFDVFIPYHFNGTKYFYSMYTFKEHIYCNEVSIYQLTDGVSEKVLEFNGHKDAAGSSSLHFVF